MTRHVLLSHVTSHIWVGCPTQMCDMTVCDDTLNESWHERMCHIKRMDEASRGKTLSNCRTTALAATQWKSYVTPLHTHRIWFRICARLHTSRWLGHDLCIYRNDKLHYTCMHVHVYVCVYMYTYIHFCVCMVYTYMCMIYRYTYMYIYIYIYATM